MTCDNCAQRTSKIVPCPCGLGDECPIPFGICMRCHRTIASNAAQRRNELRKAA